MTHKEKLINYLDIKRISKAEFYKIIGVSNNYLSRGDSFNSSILPNIRKYYPDLNIDWLLFDEGEMIKSYNINVRKNNHNTASILLKNFKKYLHLANDEGIKTDIKYTDIKIKQLPGKIIFLQKEELNRFISYYYSKDIVEVHKNVLQRFIFACFSGLRISDVQQIEKRNITGRLLSFQIRKTGIHHAMSLNDSALKFINRGDLSPSLFSGKYTDQYINRILKGIAAKLKVKNNITFHVSRHTCATHWIAAGGDVVRLKNYLGHQDIKTTMIYLHLAQLVNEDQAHVLDDRFKEAFLPQSSPDKV